MADVKQQHNNNNNNYHAKRVPYKYSEIPLLRPPKIKTFYPFKPFLQSIRCSFLHFLHPMSLWLETTFGTVQKWSLWPLLDSSKGGLNIGILLYVCFDDSDAYAEPIMGPRSLAVCLRLLLSHFLKCANRKGSGKTVHLCRPTWTDPVLIHMKHVEDQVWPVSCHTGNNEGIKYNHIMRNFP